MESGKVASGFDLRNYAGTWGTKKSGEPRAGRGEYVNHGTHGRHGMKRGI